ncbi:hypothetical protein SLS62_003552 [Diatrype stigma]|uniref:Peptidase M10 metallopeptidase domain-containing protein n=1 Tax=Diatrype stigma TaxID=117547 RepID=A0AAN9YTY6_9PEZI
MDDLSPHKINAIVRRASQLWQTHANISFRFVPNSESAVVRIKCVTHPDPWKVGGWSHLGREAQNMPKEKHTLELSIGNNSSAREISSVALHEFGHVLGITHEHASPLCPIEWNVPAVIAAYGDPAFVNHNVLRREDPKDTEYSDFDPESIMLYPIPHDWMKNRVETKPGKGLSTMDKEWVGRLYPFPESTMKRSHPHQHHRRSNSWSEERNKSASSAYKTPDRDLLERGMKIFRCEQKNCQDIRQCDKCYYRMMGQFKCTKEHQGALEISFIL